MVKNNNITNPEYYSTVENLKGKKLTTSLQFTPNKNIGTCYWAIQNVPQCLQYHNKCQINKQMRKCQPLYNTIETSLCVRPQGAQCIKQNMTTILQMKQVMP